MAQITRLFDKTLHQEFVFCSYLEKLLPSEQQPDFVLGNKVKLEYYQLQKTFEGAIELDQQSEPLRQPESPPRPMKPEEIRNTLQEVIRNDQRTLQRRFYRGRPRNRNPPARQGHDRCGFEEKGPSGNQKMFVNSLFPRFFDQMTQEAYTESVDAYAKLFEDAEKYRIIMRSLGETVFREFRAMEKEEPPAAAAL